MLFGSVGVAYTNPKMTLNLGEDAQGQLTKWQWGFAGSIGMETPLTKSWSLSMETLYTDLGNKNLYTTVNTTTSYIPSQLNCLRLSAALNYHFS